jgi:hypothetical protein
MIPFSDGRRGLEVMQAAAERRQREHELSRALEAARTLQERLELLGDRASDVAVVRSLRDSLARDLGALG